ncbi:MAG: Na+/H+ antiporter NhaA type [uncultured Sphingomonadaceae bacterium]|uniref:Na(+)/H(+) antiporter NhaA n=1 Tax=uncultured Sphingomonadaceae bacterium TaxID=169976 RepID=A0A6J4SI65_9SPHN|nr:MAG: Na+/H+ antiporter NhaA type [uncultured Sphingomonadaceae bacterium]
MQQVDVRDGRMGGAQLGRAASMLRTVLQQEPAAGILLMAAAALALLVANSPLAPAYFAAKGAYVGPLNVDHWINDGLMAVFFLLVGLEVKREFLDGQLSTWERRVLPGIAAVAGMAAPAAVYLLVNAGNPAATRGWAIPSATDIAFALGVLALLGRRVPVSLKIFLTTVAVVDDLGAVAIIALFYTEQLAILPLAAGLLGLGVLFGMNRAGVRRLLPYMAVGAGIWLCVLNSGVHATLAGVAVALTIPIIPTPGRPESVVSPLHRLEHGLHPWVAFGIVPIFGFANAGVSFAGVTVAEALSPVPLGIALGLFVGKQVGIFGAVWAAVKLRLADLPADATWAQVYGVSLLCGIGFTMSLFIGALAFPGADAQDGVKLGVLGGSLLAALLGYLVLRVAKPAPRAG